MTTGNLKILPLRLQNVAKGVEIKCKIENKKINSQGAISLKENQIMQVQNKRNEEQTT